MQAYLSIAADFLMICASAGAGIYCMVLSRRLTRLTSFDKGLGGAIAVMSAQVDEMKAALVNAKSGSDAAGRHLGDLTRQAREIGAELEMMIAACHDFAEEAIAVQTPDPAPPPIKDETSPQSADDTPPIFGSRRNAERAAPVFHHRATART